MEIDIRAMGFTLTEGIRDHVESRINSALRPFAAWVVKVTARLEDVNANHGGIDKRCSVVAAIRRRGTIVRKPFKKTCMSLRTKLRPAFVDRCNGS